MDALRQLHPRVVLSVFALSAALNAGCAATTSRLGNMWRDESFQTSGLRNVLVIAMRQDQVRRRLWEDSFVKGLESHGVMATPSYKFWQGELPDTNQVTDAVRRVGYDGVLVNLRAPDTEMQTLVPGYTRREAVTRQNPFTGAYYTYWRDVDTPGYVESERVAHFRTDLWTTTEGGRLVWSGASETTDGVDEKLIDTQTQKLVLPELVKSGVISAKVD